MIKTHELKVWPEFFKPLWNDTKKFEVRRNDRGYQVGDRLLLKEWNPEFQEYTGVMVFKRVTYILDDPALCKSGFVVMAIE
ncbi:DUF3850 domain-containing protein [Paenibacillus sp. LHD-117]|uniref:DUF3850 domain-containing protein n=1 Tax=Paenibacillus sp. LHD-117 TaxID=3071412 RepID=UPI0027DF7419|nr:DUF3850 domain-containing protein [Paenibacillus sp. LHD-117]MDQ6418688.1 DUF3850 domain-containing protein [Paenibacillus sp. LHD-117]